MNGSGVEFQEVTGEIIRAAVRIHRDLGPGLLESVYESLLCSALRDRGIHVVTQQSVSFSYQSHTFRDAFRVDMLVEQQVVVELKAVSRLEPVFHRQLLTYLKLMQLRVGLLLHFGAPTMKEGTKRIVNPSLRPDALLRSPAALRAPR